MGLEGRGLIGNGAPADLFALKAHNYSEMLPRFQFDRTVPRTGKAIDTSLPDYRLLHELMAA